MKTIYCCEKCGTQYDDYNEACVCENSHVNLDKGYEYGKVLRVRDTWRKGDVMPYETIMTVDAWDVEKEKYVPVFARYRLLKELSAHEAAEIVEASKAQHELEEREWEEMRKRREAREAEAANQESAE